MGASAELASILERSAIASYLNAAVNDSGPVFEYCDHIRRYRFNLPLNSGKKANCRFTLLRLFNSYTDFSSHYSRVMKEHTSFMTRMAEKILLAGGIVTKGEERRIREAHHWFDKECTSHLLPRVKRIQLSCNYNIKSIERLLNAQSQGTVPAGTVAQDQIEYLQLSAYPVLKDINEYIDKDIQTIQQHTQMIFPILIHCQQSREMSGHQDPYLQEITLGQSMVVLNNRENETIFDHSSSSSHLTITQNSLEGS